MRWCKGPSVIVWIVIASVVLLVGIILLALSFSIVERDEYGLKINTTTQKIIGDVDTSGRHFVGVGKGHITYPRRYVGISYAVTGSIDMDKMSCWTKSGQNVYLEISLQVKITKNKLTRFYLNYGENWKAYFVRYVIKEVKDATTQFEVSQFFEERELISDTLQSAASAIIEQKSDGALQLMDFQFRKVEIDEDFEQAIESKLVSALEKTKASQQREILKFEKDASAIYQQATNNITMLYAEKQGTGNRTLKETEGKHFYDLYKQEAILIKSIVNSLFPTSGGSTTANQDTYFMHIMLLNALRDLEESSKYYLGLGFPDVVESFQSQSPYITQQTSTAGSATIPSTGSTTVPDAVPPSGT